VFILSKENKVGEGFIFIWFLEHWPRPGDETPGEGCKRGCLEPTLVRNSRPKPAAALPDDLVGEGDLG